MRIPSDFNDDNLYRRRNDPNSGQADSKSGQAKGVGQVRGRRMVAQERTTTARRLLRLAVGLVLVIFLMRHAARPEIYETFFAEPLQKVPSDATHLASPMANGGAPLGPTTSSYPSAVETSFKNQERSTLILYPADTPQFAEAERVTKALTREEQVLVLATESSDKSSAEAAKLLRSVVETIATGPRASTEVELDRPRWTQLVDQLTASSGLDEPSRRLYATLQMACLRAAMDRVIDGSVWRGKDLDAFYAALTHRDLIEASSRVQTGVVPLLQQPEVYRGRALMIVGQVVRGEQFTAAANSFGVDQYWQLWLHPVDGSERPIVAIVTTLPASLQSRLTSDNDEELIPLVDAPRVQIDGMYLKRLAYRSAEGAALAPAIVGYVAAASGGQVATQDNGRSTTDGMPDGATWATLVVTALLGVGGAVLLMLRVNYTNKKLRALRRKKRNAELSWLSDSDD